MGDIRVNQPLDSVTLNTCGSRGGCLRCLHVSARGVINRASFPVCAPLLM